MSWWENLRLRFYRSALQQRLRARRVQPRSMPFGRVKRVSLLFDATELATRETVQRYADQLRKRGKEVKLLGFLRGQNAQPDLGFANFGSKDLDWRYLPKLPLVEDYLAKSFDLLINLDLEHHRALEYVAALADVPFRVGSANGPTDHYELMIEAPERALPAFWKQVDHYLQQMNAPHAGIT